MSDNDVFPGFDDFLLSAEEIRSSANSVIKDGIKYNVQSNVARCLVSINENKATGEALVKIGLEEAMISTWGSEFMFDVKIKIYGDEAIKSQPELFDDAFKQPDIFLTVLANTIDEIVGRGFVCVICNQFGLNPTVIDDLMGEVSSEALHFPNEWDFETKEALEQFFHSLRVRFEKIDRTDLESIHGMIWQKETGNVIPPNWNMILAPNLDLMITW